MVRDSAFHFHCFCYCDTILKQHLRDVSGPRCWQIWPGCMLIQLDSLAVDSYSFMLMCVINLSCARRCGAFIILQQFRKKPQSSTWSWLNRNCDVASLRELPMCFVKQGPSFISCKMLPKMTKMGDTNILLWEGLTLPNGNYMKENNCFLKISPSSPSQGHQGRKQFLIELGSRSCCIFSKSVYAVFCQQISINLALAPVDQKIVRMRSRHTAGSHSQLINSHLFIFNE